jgi:hypothetical protein
MLVAGAICGGLGIFVGFLNDYQNKNCIYNINPQKKPQTSVKWFTPDEKEKLKEWWCPSTTTPAIKPAINMIPKPVISAKKEIYGCFDETKN